MGTHHGSRLILCFFSVDVERVTTSMSSRPIFIVGGPIVTTTISTAGWVNYQLILSHGALPGEVTWLVALEAQPILRTKRGSIGWRWQSSWPWWWRRQTGSSIRRPRNRDVWHGHTVREPDTTLLSCARR